MKVLGDFNILKMFRFSSNILIKELHFFRIGGA